MNREERASFTVPGVTDTLCKKCTDTTKAPIDGKCAVPVDATDHCTASGGACSDCKKGDVTNSKYFLFYGGVLQQGRCSWEHAVRDGFQRCL